jgi:hypothetical protein
MKTSHHCEASLIVCIKAVFCYVKCIYKESLVYLIITRLINGIFLGFEFKLRTVGRRVVMGLVVNLELDLTEIRVRQLHKVVDIFVLLESNITAGKKKIEYWGKGQNVENHFIESQKKNIESLKFEKDQNVESLI